MAYTTVPFEDVKLPELKETLQIHGGHVTNKLSSFFKTETNINKWAKFKPIAKNTLAQLDFASQKASNFGLVASTFTGTVSGTSIVYSGITPWTHSLPQGGITSPYRLSDFCGYYPLAMPPVYVPKEVFRNVAAGNPVPSIICKYNYNGIVNGNGLAAMECELEGALSSLNLGANYSADEVYLCVISEGEAVPYRFVANAGSPLSVGGTSAYTIDFGKFSIMHGMLGKESEFGQADNSYAYGAKYTFQVGLNYLENRAAGQVFTNPTYNLSTHAFYSDDIPGYNGLHNGTFINLPQGNVTIDYYSYWLLGWMYGIVGNIRLLSYNHTDYYAYMLDFIPGNTNVNSAYYQFLEETYSGYCDLEFVMRIANTGGSLKIGSKTFTVSADNPVTVSFNADASAANVISLFLSNNRGSASSAWLPKLKAFTNGSTFIYTQFEGYEMGTSFGYSAQAWAAVYNSDGEQIGSISSGSTAPTNSIVYGGVTYNRASTTYDIYSHRVGNKYYGIYDPNTASEYNKSVTIYPGNTIDCPVRVRIRGSQFPMWVQGDSDPQGTVWLEDFFVFNSGLINKISKSGSPIQYPFFITAKDRSNTYMEFTCTTAGNVAQKVLTGSERFWELRGGFLESSDRMVVNFTNANSAANPTMKFLAFLYGENDLESPVVGTITAGLNYFHYYSGQWIKE